MSKKWEYRVFWMLLHPFSGERQWRDDMSTYYSDEEACLNAKGAAGWELVGFEDSTYTFKREISE
jgi:hypothetical protein